MVKRGYLNNINVFGSTLKFEDRVMALLVFGAGLPFIVIVMSCWILAIGRAGASAFKDPMITAFYSMDDWDNRVITVFGFFGYASMPWVQYLLLGDTASLFFMDRFAYNPKTDPDCWSTAAIAAGVAVPDSADFCYACRKSSLVGAGIIGTLIGASVISILHVCLVILPWGKWYEEHLPCFLSPKDLHIALTGCIFVVGFSGLGTFNPCKDAITEFYQLTFANLGSFKVRWGGGFWMMVISAVVFFLGALLQLLMAWPTQLDTDELGDRQLTAVGTPGATHAIKDKEHEQEKEMLYAPVHGAAPTPRVVDPKQSKIELQQLVDIRDVCSAETKVKYSSHKVENASGLPWESECVVEDAKIPTQPVFRGKGTGKDQFAAERAAALVTLEAMQLHRKNLRVW